jgi:hypothetical protein
MTLLPVWFFSRIKHAYYASIELFPKLGEWVGQAVQHGTRRFNGIWPVSDPIALLRPTGATLEKSKGESDARSSSSEVSPGLRRAAVFKPQHVVNQRA